MSRLEVTLRWGPAAAATLAIAVLGSVRTVPGVDLGSDKIAHLAAFAVVAVLWVRGFQGRLVPCRGSAVVGAMAVAAAVGIALEIWQSFLPWREASLGDAVADAIGALLGGGAVVGVDRWIANRNRASR